MLKRFLSYIFPQILLLKPSKISNELSVTLVDGRMVLNTPNANYSFGSLQRILEKGLTRIGKSTIENMQSVLLLGVAGGSVIQSLQTKYGFKGVLTGVEIDENAIVLANDYFGLSEYKQVEIIQADAQDFVQQTTTTFDLIIIDIFQDVQMPAFLFEEKFITQVQQLLKPEGYILFNTMVTTAMDKIRNEKFVSNFPVTTFQITRLPMLERYNEVLIFKRK